jgi:hypothetical protein
MAVFTLVASYIVTAAIGITGAAVLGAAGVAFVTSVVAVGLALATSRLLGLTGGAGGTAQDPGVRIQFPPATNNKIPIVYGTVNTKGVVTDARISNENKTMTYVLAISEKTQTGVFSIGDVYWNDQKLVFDPDNAESHIVRSSIDQNGQGETSTNFDGLIRVRVYSGNTNSSSQIFPPQSTGNTENAKTLLGESDINYMLNDLVFAVIQIDYNGEKGITGLGQITFQLSNTLNNPALVWYDYMTSARYGAAIPTAQINTSTSVSTSNPLSVFNYSNEVPANQFDPVSNFAGSISGTVLTVTTSSGTYPITGTIAVGQRLFGNAEDGTIITSLGSGSGGEGTYNISISQSKSLDKITGATSSTQARYVINGVISTGDTVKNSIEKITQSAAAWSTFDYSEGKWKLLNNRAASVGELSAAFEFNDDNILGEVGIAATNLEDLYNRLEVEFASRKIRDQNDYYKAEIDPSEMNDLEPPNTLNMRLEMVNNALHSARVGIIELKQSRVDKIITFRADYSAIQCEAGDVVKVTNSVYGFVNKLFRISKLREIEGEEGSITVEVTALEYDADIYIDETLLDSADTPGSGIPVFGGSETLPAPSTPTATGNATASTPFFVVSTQIAAGSIPVDSVDFLISTSPSGPFTSLAVVVGPFVSGTTVNSPNIAGRPSGTYYFRAKTIVGARASTESASSSAFSWALTPATPPAPFWDQSTSTNVDLFPNASTPFFYIHTEIPAGTITVSSVTFQYSTSSSSGFTSLITMNGPYTAGTDVRTTAITGVPAGTYYFRAFSTNNGNNSSVSTSSIALVWNPSPTIDGGTIP